MPHSIYAGLLVQYCILPDGWLLPPWDSSRAFLVLPFSKVKMSSYDSSESNTLPKSPSQTVLASFLELHKEKTTLTIFVCFIYHFTHYFLHRFTYLKGFTHLNRGLTFVNVHQKRSSLCILKQFFGMILQEIDYPHAQAAYKEGNTSQYEKNSRLFGDNIRGIVFWKEVYTPY